MASSARIEELEKKFNENPRRYFAPLANEYRKAGDVQQAIAICRTYVPQQPGHMSGHIVFGQALFEAGDHDEARGVFEAALGLDPENLIALRHLGDIAREHGETDDARAWYRRVLDADPRNDEVAALLTSVEAEEAAQAADAPATWTEINPEQTLELPPDVLAAVPRDIGFASGASPRFPASPANSMGELFDGSEDETPAADAAGAATLEFRSSSYAVPEGAGYVDEAARTVPTFVTETMAELYVQQGFYDRALSVYRQLLTQHPGDPKLAERMEQLRRESAASGPGVPGTAFDVASAVHSAPDRRSVREFFNELALRQPKVRLEASAKAAPASHVAGEQEDSAAVAANEPAVVPDAGDAAAVSAPGPTPAEPSEPVAAAEAAQETAEATDGAPRDEKSPAGPPIATPADDLAPEVAPDDTKHLPHDLDIGLSDTSYHETYSAEFGASALAVPDDAEDDGHSGGSLFEGSGAGADSFVARPSSEADPFALFAFTSTNESSEFDVTAFEGSNVHPSHGEPAPGSQESAPNHPDSMVAADAATPLQATPLQQRESALGGSSSGADDVSGGAESAAARSGEAARRAAMQIGSLNVLFPERTVSAPDEAAAAALSSAFGGPSFQPEVNPAPAVEGKAEAKATANAGAKPDVAGAGGSARPALNELSLDSVFRESPAAAPDPRREPSAFSFDQFFGETPQAAAPGSASGADSLLGDSLDVGSADAEQFSNWLSGLKKK